MTYFTCHGGFLHQCISLLPIYGLQALPLPSFSPRQRNSARLTRTTPRGCTHTTHYSTRIKVSRTLSRERACKRGLAFFLSGVLGVLSSSLVQVVSLPVLRHMCPFPRSLEMAEVKRFVPAGLVLPLSCSVSNNDRCVTSTHIDSRKH